MAEQQRLAANPLKSKIDQVVTRKLGLDKDFISVAEYVAPLMEGIELDTHAERKLLRKLERKDIDLRRQYLAEFEKANKMVQSVNCIAQEMNKAFGDLAERIEHAKRTNTKLMLETQRLQSQKRNVEVQRKAIDEFIGKYSITDEEIQYLDCEMRDIRLTPQFFSALKNAKKIYEDSKSLVQSSGNSRAGIEVMDKADKWVKMGYSAIVAKLPREIRLLNSDFADAKGVISKSFCALQDFPHMFQVTLEEYSSIRGNEVLRQYIEALTKGPYGSGKPIELMSHDKLRYIGDMLAFIFEVAENEKSILEVLLADCDQEVFVKNVRPVLAVVTKPICAPFKVRVEQTLSTESECNQLFRISKLFSFYIFKFISVLGDDSELIKTLSDLCSLSMTMFYAGLNSNVQKILSRMGAPDYDLLPVQAVHQCLMLLKEVLNTHDCGMGSRPEAKEDFQKIFEYILDPLSREVQLTATQLHSPLDVAVYTLNCLSAIHSVVVLYQFADKRLEMINAMIESNEDVLVSEELAAILNQTSLITIYQKASAHHKEQGPLSAVPGMEKSVISASLAKFAKFLHNPNSCQLDHVSKISSSKIRESVRRRSVSELLNVYSCLVAKFSDEMNGYCNDQEFNYLNLAQVTELLEWGLNK